MSHEITLDQENRRWRICGGEKEKLIRQVALVIIEGKEGQAWHTKIALKSMLDCHAWNLPRGNIPST